MMQRRVQEWGQGVPKFVKLVPEDTIDDFVNKGIDKASAKLELVVTGLVGATTSTFVEMLWIGLYMVFWLFQPFHVGKEVSSVFRRYILVKGVASMGYAFCVWLLLHWLSVDLSVV